MLDPDKLQQQIIPKNESNIEVVHFDTEIPEYDKEEYNLFNDKEFKTYMTDLERLVRGSLEYKRLVKFCRENMNMNKCSFYENVNNIDTFKIKIELHHTPFGLYDICKIVFNKRIFYHESLAVEDVAEEVVLLHYCGMIGLIPVSETVHELIHNFYIIVPANKVMGRFCDFYEMYKPFMDPEHIDVYNRIMDYSRIYNEEENMNILKRNYIHIDYSGNYKLPKLEEVLSVVTNKLYELKNSIPQYK
jgi:uncharacterized protein YlaN (UPF0358 family)